MKRCVKCLSTDIKRTLAGNPKGTFKIFQCECGFNVTATTWKEAEQLWNGFAVWTLVPEGALNDVRN